MSIQKGFSAAGMVGRLGVIVAVLLVASVAAADIGDGALTFTNVGVGVAGYQSGPESASDEIGFYPGDGGETEALSVDLGKEAVSAQVVLSFLYSGEGELASWQAFSSTGVEVGSGTVSGFSDGTGSFAIGGTAAFRYLVFSALPLASNPGNLDNSEFYVQSITVVFADHTGTTFGGLNAGAAAWAGAGLSAFNFGTPFLDANGRFVGAAPEIVVNDQACSTGQGTDNKSCKIPFTDALQTTIAGEDVEGTISVAGISTVVDFRFGCGFSGINPGQKLSGASKPISEIGGALDLGFALDPLHPDVTGPIVPAHLCGIPQTAIIDPQTSSGDGQFVLVDLDAAVAVSRSVIEHEVQNDSHPDYDCASGTEVLKAADRDERRSRLPVFGWLPKTSNPEIPVLDGYGDLVPVLEDVTTGCGSTRSGASRLSFLVYDLRHALQANYRSIIGDDIEQLKVTVDETRACVQPLHALELKARVALIRTAYQKNRLGVAKLELIGLLRAVQTARLDAQFAQCGFDLEQWDVKRVGPAYPDLVSRNFRGDLVVQTRHILYMMDRMLGVTSPPVPAGL